MKYTLLLSLMALAFSSKSVAQCSENETPKVLLVGDSWAFFMSVDQTINDVLFDWGHTGYTYYTNLTLAENGAETDDFLLPAKQQEIQAKLNEFPSIEVVHLSIGGNDVLGDWNINFTQQQTDSLANAVLARLDSVITFIKSARPGIQILWSGYTYPNFEEVIESAAPFQTQHPFYGTWEGMGFPNFLQLNDVQNNFSNLILNFYANDSQVHYVPATGLMQYVFGQTSPLGVAPGGTYAPFSVPLPLGDPTYPSPKNTMRNYGLTRDCFHLSAAGYYELINYHAQKYYHKFLMDDYFALANATESGSVSATGTVSADLNVGEINGSQVATVLSFDLAIPDTAIQQASLFLKVAEITGTNLLNAAFELKLIDGQFGSQAAVESGDFSANGTVVGTPCTFGAKEAGKWVRFDLPTSMISAINAGKIQISMSSSNASGASVRFVDATDSDFAPVLNLKFGAAPASLAENALDSIQLFPVPTDGMVHVNASSDAELISVMDLAGREISVNLENMNSIDFSEVPTGIYLLNFKIGNAFVSKKIVKI